MSTGNVFLFEPLYDCWSFKKSWDLRFSQKYLRKLFALDLMAHSPV